VGSRKPSGLSTCQAPIGLAICATYRGGSISGTVCTLGISGPCNGRRFVE